MKTRNGCIGGVVLAASILPPALYAQQGERPAAGPNCRAPVPLTGKPVARDSPRVIIFLRDTTSSADNQGRALAARYGVRFLTEMLALPAFVAITTPPALAQLRCDPAVREIVYDELERLGNKPRNGP
jgi:hypothetical protein